MSWACLIAAALMLTAAVLIFAMDMAATDPGRYIAIHERIQTDTGLTDEGIIRADRTLADFLKGRDNLEYDDSVYGVTTRVFNAREIEHMNDVRDIFIKVRRIELLAWILSLALVLGAIWLCQKDALSRALKSVNIAISAIVLIFAAGAIVISRDFSTAFIGMHGLLFNNELWLMNPETDLMIRLLPEKFFMAMAQEMALSALWALLALAALSTAGILAVKAMRKRRQ